MTWKITSHGLRGLNAMNNLGLLMTWTTLGHVVRALNAWTTQSYGWYVPLWVTSLRLWMFWTTKHCEIYEWLDILWAKAIKCYEQLRLWMIWMILNHELRVVDDMNDFELWAHNSRCYEQLKVMVDMNDFRSWAQGSGCYEQLRVVGNMNDSGSYELMP